MADNNTTRVSVTRPKQVLLVGLGGVGSRTVDRVLSIMPDEYKPYTKAIAIDTDLEDLDVKLVNIPIANRISLGTNPENNQSITIGEYIKNHPETMDWFVKGEQLDLVARRNTSQGAKQIRMVSRIALAATDAFCGMTEQLKKIVHEFNHADGAIFSRGLRVMIVCSVAGGTGAGTVLQVPFFLDKALSDTFSKEDYQIECSMLLPNMFRRTLSKANYEAAKANVYAVIRELMSLTDGRITKKDVVGSAGSKKSSDRGSPFERVMFFDDVSMSGDSVEGSLDVYVPRTAEALNEYLFGAVEGPITSALDNTLRAAYDSKGKAIFCSVGNSRLEFPRQMYFQYVTGQWVSKAITDTWLYPDKRANEVFSDLCKQAAENGGIKPDTKKKRSCYCAVIEGEESPFYKEIKLNFIAKNKKNENQKVDWSLKKCDTIVKEFWDGCKTYLKKKVDSDAKLSSNVRIIENNLKSKAEASAIETNLKKLDESVTDVTRLGYQFEMEVMRPFEVNTPQFFLKEENEICLFTFLKKKKLHPIMLRYFLYKLYFIAEEEAQKPLQTSFKYDDLKTARNHKEYIVNANTLKSDMQTAAQNGILRVFAKRLLQDLDTYIKEVEDMFGSLPMIVDVFAEKGNRCFEQLGEINNEPGSVLAGGPLSMMYSWHNVNNIISVGGEGAYTIDDELNGQIHEIVYKAFLEQLAAVDTVHITGRTIRVRTKYESIMKQKLEIYYTHILKTSYDSCFPGNVVEAALWECGLQNAYKDAKSGVDSTVEYTYDDFMRTRANMINYGKGENVPNGHVSDAQYLSVLLSAALGKAKPYCGRVENEGDQGGIINRLMVVNKSLLRTRDNSRVTDKFGVSKIEFIENELIDDVSTSQIGPSSVSTHFVGEGISKDEIDFVMTVAGLLPRNFVAFMPPDDNEFAPKKGESYYESYKEFLDQLSVDSEIITPHLNRNWHLVDKLADLSVDHTDTYNRDAARAFVYGFIFDIITISRGGIVNIGSWTSDRFTEIFDGLRIKPFTLLDPQVHSVIDSYGEDLKIGTLNSILVKVYELLATSEPIRNAILEYANEQMDSFAVQRLPQFVLNCLSVEDVDNYKYQSILDVVDGYYQGTRQLTYNETDRADKNTENMFNVILEGIYDTCKIFSDDLAAVRNLYEDFIKKLYKQAICDESNNKKNAESTETDPMDVFAAINKIVGKDATAIETPFVDGAKFSQQNALNMIDVFIGND